MKFTGLSALLVLASPVVAHDHEHGDRRTPPAFIENAGQWPAPVLFRSGASGATLFVERDGWTWSMYEQRAHEVMHDFMEYPKEVRDTLTFRGHAWRMRFVDPATGSTTMGMDRSKAYHNYFLGNDPAQWRSHVGLYGQVFKQEVWPGVDIMLKSEQGAFKYDVLVAPGADHHSVRMRYEGLDELALSAEGRLIMRTSVGELTEQAPVAFYGDERGGALKCVFTLSGDVVGFEFPDGLDRTRPVVIDPLLVGATYSGATGSSVYGHCAAFDDSGNMFSAGRDFGSNYPATMGTFQGSFGGGGTDMSLSKYTPNSSELLWASYLGGNSGENPHSLITNPAGELIVIGSTSSPDFPVSANAYDDTQNGQDIVVVHFALDGGSIIGSTYIGGSGDDGTNNMGGNYGEAYRGEVYVDQVGNILVASFSSSADFPVVDGAVQSTTGGGQDGVLFKLDPTCSNLLASTFIGGSQDDAALGLRLAANGDVFVVGHTEGSGFNMPAGGYMPSYQGGATDVYVLRFTDDLNNLVAGTYFGTPSSDRGYFIDLDSEDNVWIYGQTDGAVPVYPEGTYGESDNGNNYLAKFTTDLSDRLVTTMIPGNVAPVAFLVDVCDHVYMSGYAAGGDLPLTEDALQTTGSFYLAAFDVDLAGILFGTHYGGSHVDGGTSRFDKNGFVYQGVCSGGQSMQSTPWAYAPNNQISWDIAVFKIDFETAGVQASISSNSLSQCIPAVFNLTASGQAQEFQWDLGDGSPIQTGTEITVSYDEVGTYFITLIGVDPGACNLADTTFITLQVFDPNVILADFEPIATSSCDGYFLDLTNNSEGGNQYNWTFGDGMASTTFEPTHAYDGPGTYEVGLQVVNTVCADTARATVPVTFTTPSIENTLPTPVPLCDGAAATLDAGLGFDSYAWSTGASQRTIQVNAVGQYWVTVTDGACAATDTVQVIFAPPPPPTPDQYTCGGRAILISPAFNATNVVWSNGQEIDPLPVSVGGDYGFSAVDAYGCPVQGSVRVIELPTDRGEGFVPNVFTPNNDSQNDEFEIVGEGIDQFHMTIYDRWGLKMFESNNQGNGWNGGADNARSAPVPDGTYYYIIDFKDFCSEEPKTTLKGHVTLLR